MHISFAMKNSQYWNMKDILMNKTVFKQQKKSCIYFSLVISFTLYSCCLFAQSRAWSSNKYGSISISAIQYNILTLKTNS